MPSSCVKFADALWEKLSEAGDRLSEFRKHLPEVALSPQLAREMSWTGEARFIPQSN